MSTDENVRHMLDHPGIYVTCNVQRPEELIVIFSQDGVLRALSVDQVLSPEGFAPGLIIKHGPLV